ncbi:MAG: ribonuclease R [Clostridiales bacterium]|jgi:ribonuclease R|nr:ribonuclease R [Clostridiales bacterium]
MTYNEFLKSHGIPAEFPSEVVNQAALIPDEISEKDIKKRRDLRRLKIVTIDGDDAKDLDDAISIEQLKNGNYSLGVHIADVSHYVKEKSPIDREALERGTSTYLINKVVPMLPQKLSNGICSLNPRVDRLTLTIFMEIDQGGGIANYNICESIIRTSERMTYGDVTKILDGDAKLHKRYEPLVDDFFLMRKLAKILENKRIKRGSLIFDIPEPKIVLDENDVPIEIGKHEITISNKIIEEFMLVANETIARHINKLEIPLIYRVHESPEADKIAKFVVMLRGLGYKLQRGLGADKGEIKPKYLQTLSNQIKGKSCETAISTIMLRSLMKARYCEENLGHFGLAAKYYCHFTSPIRRYPDLVVHRVVKDWLNGRIDDKRKKNLSVFTADAAKKSSEAEIKAMNAEREWDDYKICEYMEDKIGEEYENAYITSVTSFGLFVALDNLAEGLIRISNLRNDYYIYDEAHYLLRGKRTRQEFRIGDRLHVKLVRVNKEAQQIDFEIVEDKEDKKKKKGASGGKNESKKEQKGGNKAKNKFKSKMKWGKNGRKSSEKSGSSK